MAFIVSLLFAFVPAFLMAAFIYWLDRYEKEPLILLGAAFFWGAVVAAGFAFVFNTISGLGIYALTGSGDVADQATASVVAPFVEEGLKGLAVLLVFLFFRKEFDSVLDGIIYADDTLDLADGRVLVSTHAANGCIVAEIDAVTAAPARIELHFDGAALVPVAFEQGETGSAPVLMQDGRVRIEHRGRNHYRLVLAEKGAGNSGLRIRVQAGDAVREATLRTR